MSEAPKEPRNAQAGAKQIQAAEQPVREDSELTKRNAEYMRQMRKALNATSLAGDKKKAALDEMTTTLLTEQHKGTTARQLYGTVQERTQEIIEGPKKAPAEQARANYWITALDNGLMLFMIFCLMYGAIGFFGKTSSEQAGAQGITAILITSAVGGLGVAKLFDFLQPASKDKKKQVPTWRKILWSVLAIVAWMMIFTLAAALPTTINPALSAIWYLIIAAIVFVARLWLKRRFKITTSLF
ncbi:DUF1129 domain-containing protein [Lactiplantibacillus mudanjiangensis]|uniref:Uncharacterized protein n=1 Tax=Lactiplantibacillus mudanjiangensis TaxID=1296538 RepID=A0A660E001_9LACO|nr:DUF1129 domain-containing protein [Lactiplantibacillus mudanjiangensis]VDG20306.1 hypothetical protein MUDAN_BIHEEGNE_01924 [Lactiplantibacillus mudanjiangensis]VDG24000.1 hypothetical protein MUDAN_IGPPGNFN_00620 [Lactiplantibacillus mudanjiangensis]VDG27231.1 hypothetical protein MUDAN_MDHGFNIF_02158 [Lactiplantibacillus mudanjiangensis]VDG33911.1 hypothetical protein MUDAN_DOGOELCO_03034 [Lactiplantibacillus mudanjiangensis]